MQVNQEDYEDKLHQINRLNREVQALKQRVDTVKHQRDTIMECLIGIYERALYAIENQEYTPEIKGLVAHAREIVGQSETM
jgi:prefoldin subunit 5